MLTVTQQKEGGDGLTPGLPSQLDLRAREGKQGPKRREKRAEQPPAWATDCGESKPVSWLATRLEARERNPTLQIFLILI
jgi:hypothetical protein